MRKLQILRIIVPALTVAVLFLWRFVIPFPYRAVRMTGIFMLVCVFAVVFSSVRVAARKK